MNVNITIVKLLIVRIHVQESTKLRQMILKIVQNTETRDRHEANPFHMICALCSLRIPQWVRNPKRKNRNIRTSEKLPLMRRPSRKVADAGTSGIGKDEKEFAAGGDVDGVRRRRMRTKITNEGLQPPPPVLPLREGGRGEGRRERESKNARIIQG